MFYLGNSRNSPRQIVQFHVLHITLVFPRLPLLQFCRPLPRIGTSFPVEVQVQSFGLAYRPVLFTGRGLIASASQGISETLQLGKGQLSKLDTFENDRFSCYFAEIHVMMVQNAGVLVFFYLIVTMQFR